MKKTVRTNIVDLPYSLHDAHINKIQVKQVNEYEAKVKLFFDGGFFVPRDGDTVHIAGRLLFEKVDLDYCSVYVLNTTGKKNRKIKGKEYELKAFAKKYKVLDMEIVDETYGYNQSKFSGFMYSKNKMYEFIIEMYHLGDMTYVTEE